MAFVTLEKDAQEIKGIMFASNYNKSALKNIKEKDVILFLKGKKDEKGTFIIEKAEKLKENELKETEKMPENVFKI